MYMISIDLFNITQWENAVRNIRNTTVQYKMLYLFFFFRSSYLGATSQDEQKQK